MRFLLWRKTDEEIREYFKRVGNYFELLVLNLGETHKEEFHAHGKKGFHLDTAKLHPGRTIETVDELFECQSDHTSKDDVDAIINALRLPCFIAGDRELFDEYVKKLEEYHQSKAEELGTFLLTKWKAPVDNDVNWLDVKKDFYRQSLFSSMH